MSEISYKRETNKMQEIVVWTLHAYAGFCYTDSTVKKCC